MDGGPFMTREAPQAGAPALPSNSLHAGEVITQGLDPVSAACVYDAGMTTDSTDYTDQSGAALGFES